MFKVNTSNEIEVGGTLNIGTIGLAEDSGVVTLVNMPVSSTPSVGTEESYSFAIDSEPILKVYSEADGTGGIQNKRVGIGTTSPDYQLTVTEDFGFDDASMYIEDISGTTTVYSNNFYGLSGSNYLKPAETGTALNVAGVIQVNGSGNNYFAGNVGIGTATPDVGLHVYGAGVGSYIRAENSNGPQIDIEARSGDAYVGTVTSHNLRLMTGNSARITIDTSGNTYMPGSGIWKNDGNVGIGITSPAASTSVLPVMDTIIQIGNNTNAPELRLAGPNSADVSSKIVFDNSSSGAGMSMFFTSDTTPYGPDGLVFWDENNGRANLKMNRDNGNVGIGTVDPQAKLDIWGGDIYLNDASEADDKFAATVGYVKEAVEGSAGVGIWRDAGTYIYPNTSSNVVIEDGGDVGIGTTNPGAKLEVWAGENTPTTGTLVVESNAVTVGAIHGAGDNAVFTVQNRGGTDVLKVDSNTNGHIVMTPQGTGNVGIGTTLPGAKLDIRESSTTSELRLQGYIDSDDDVGGRIMFKNTHVPTSYFDMAKIEVTRDAGTWNTGLDFYTRPAGSLTQAMRIAGTGNVAIGTTTAAFKLDVLTQDTSSDSFIRVQRVDDDLQRVGLTLYDDQSTSFWSMYADMGSADLLFEEDGTVAATITTDGYFGIGPDYLTPQGLLDVNNKFIVTDTQVTMNVPLNLAAAGDISIASDLQFTSPTASYIKSYAPLYIEAGDPSQNVDLTLRGSNLGEVIVDDNLKVTGNAVITGGLTMGSATLVGNIDMQNYDITGVDKLTVNTIDPIHEINGKEYATFVSFYAGGQKMETSGVIQLKLFQGPTLNKYQYVIDFEKLEEGTDLWLFWETLHQDLSQLSVILTPGFNGRVWYEKIGNSKIIIHSNQQGEVSYTLVAPRYDYKKWPNLISKTD